VGNPPTGTFAELGTSNPPRPGVPDTRGFRELGWSPTYPGLSRNQLQLLYNTLKTRKKQRFYALKRSILWIIKHRKSFVYWQFREDLQASNLPWKRSPG
jgi:hypothetical protein